MKETRGGKLSWGRGIPKICVPLTGPGIPELLREIRHALALPADLYEWRMDSFLGDPLSALPAVVQALEGAPLLCTLRTKGEGGGAVLSPEEYEAFLEKLLDVGGFDLIDVELSAGEERVSRLAAMARQRGVTVVVSKHDFQRTPPAGEISATLRRMKELGAGLPKYAVTPRSPEDVLALLDATLQASRAVGPVVTMAMGELGKLTRVGGGVFGSCMTFGAGDNASAPGQLNAGDLRKILEELQPDGRNGSGGR